MTDITFGKRAEASHIWEKQGEEWYIEPRWVGRRLFEVEQFDGLVCDPCCGLGNMLAGAEAAGLPVEGYDLVDRGAPQLETTRNFLTSAARKRNFACNPPFELGEEFAIHALSLASGKVAMVYPTRRLNAAGKWISSTPLSRVWYLTPRPSMPPGPEYVRLQSAGKEASGGKQDFCILVWTLGFTGPASVGWLHRDGATA